METVIMELKINRNDEIVTFSIPELNNIEIVITDNNTSDIENLFNCILEKIIETNNIIEFKLVDEIGDLFKEVAEDIVSQLNSEIKNSENDFKKIIELAN